MSEWISVTDRLPTLHSETLIWVSWGELTFHAVAMLQNDGWESCDMTVPFDEVTHWMPLPDPPK
jgi:hypothetical protein